MISAQVVRVSLGQRDGICPLNLVDQRDANPRRLCLRWEEYGGPPVERPQRRGFGSRLIERALTSDLGGEVRLKFPPSGVVCTVEALV
jgi:two-component sensor histidine kinase